MKANLIRFNTTSGKVYSRAKVDYHYCDTGTDPSKVPCIEVVIEDRTDRVGVVIDIPANAMLRHINDRRMGRKKHG